MARQKPRWDELQNDIVQREVVDFKADKAKEKRTFKKLDQIIIAESERAPYNLLPDYMQRNAKGYPNIKALKETSQHNYQPLKQESSFRNYSQSELSKIHQMLKQGSLKQKFCYNEVGEVLKHLRHREPERTFTKELVQVGLLDPAKPQRLYRKAWREVEEFANNL